MSKHDSHSDQIIQKLTAAFARNTEAFKQMLKATQKTEQSLLKQNKKARRDAYLIAMIPLCGVVLSLAIGCYWYYKQNQNTVRQERIKLLNLQQLDYQHRLDILIEKRNKLMVAMTKMRIARVHIRSHCVGGKYVGPNAEQESENLFASDSSLIVAHMQSKGLFSDSANANNLKFLGWVDVEKHNLSTLCSGKEKTDGELQRQQKLSFNSMTAEAEGLQMKLMLANNQLKALGETAP